MTSAQYPRVAPTTAVLLVLGFLAAAIPTAATCVGGERAAPAAPKGGLAIHEWGTFTCLQDEQGRSIPGINTDDEPVPDFVHRVSELIPRPSELAPVYYKGVPRSHYDVLMRLETPVIYFHPPKGQAAPLHLSMKVGFRGGWLTEYFPRAEVTAPGLRKDDLRYGRIDPASTGILEWSDLTIGGGGEIPETDAPVWIAPRQVEAATVRTPGGEAEKYLFYRGVGNIRSPVAVAHDGESDGLVIREALDPRLGLRAPLALRAMWLVHVRDDGGVAFRPLGTFPLTGERGRTLTRVRLALREGPAPEALFDEYSPRNLDALRADMRRELIADGLFDDEADAMLNTWELAYFKSPGLRLFYLLPQEWTDAVLPLQCSQLARVSRTMVGRVEIVAPAQREQLKQISQSPVSSNDWIWRELEQESGRSQALSRLWEGKVRFNELKIPVPVDYQAYLALGRFRNALILDADRHGSQTGLSRFAEAYEIRYFTPREK